MPNVVQHGFSSSIQMHVPSFLLLHLIQYFQVKFKMVCGDGEGIMFCFYFRKRTPGFSPVRMMVGFGFSQSLNHLHFLKSVSSTII